MTKVESISAVYGVIPYSGMTIDENNEFIRVIFTISYEGQTCELSITGIDKNTDYYNYDNLVNDDPFEDMNDLGVF